MTDVQGYEGWTNRETWCANLWLANDEGLYHSVVDMAREAIDNEDEDNSADDVQQSATYALASALESFYDDLMDMVYGRGEWEDCTCPNKELANMIEDIGSAWRIDWHEIAESWVSDEMNERSDA